MAFAFNQDKAAEIFFRAFKDCANNIIRGIPHNAGPNDPTTALEMQTIAAQLNHDIVRLEYIIEVIQARVSEDEEWAPTAVKVYELLAYAIDPAFPDTYGQTQLIKGAFLVRDQMMRACQAQFQQTMNEPEWNGGILSFLGHLCTCGSITSATPSIVLHVLDLMVDSPFLAYNDNFDLLIRFTMLAGRFLHDQAGYQHHLTAWLTKLQERVKLCRATERLAVYGVLWFMERGWQAENLEVEVED